MSGASLLAIDVDSELRKLATGTLGPAHLPSDLVRAAIAGGARRVGVEVDRRGLTVRHDGAPIGVEELRLVLALVDPEAPAAERHRALVALEPVPGRLSLAVPDTDLRIETRGGGRCHVLTRERGGRPILRSLTDATGAGTVVEIAGWTTDAASARRAVLAACRFAPIDVLLDGRAIPRGFEDALAEAPLRLPLAGRLALTRTGEGGSVLLLHDGVIASRLTLPDALAFEAAVEMRPLAESRSGGALREAVTPHLSRLVAEAVSLAVAVGDRIASLAPADAARVRALLLVAARTHGHRIDVRGVAVLPAVAAGGEVPALRWLSLQDLGRDREVSSLEPHQDPSAFLLPRDPVLVLDAEERGRLAQLLGLRFRTPEPRRVDAPLAVRARRALSRAATGAARVARRLRHPRLGEELPDRALAVAERALLRALRDCDPELRLAITDGAGPVRRLDLRSWALPRRNPTVAACARAVAADPRWAYPALYALLEDRALPGPAARAAWREGGGPASPVRR